MRLSVHRGCCCTRPGHPSRAVGWGLRLALALVTVAAALCAQPAAEDPRSPEGQYRLAEGLFFRKFYDLAEAEFRAFGERYPTHALAPDAAYRLILCLRQQKKDDEELAATDRFLAAWPAHEACAKLTLRKGQMLLARGDLPGAEGVLRQLLENPDTRLRETALYFVGQCLERQGKAAEALAVYGQLAEGELDGVHEYRPYALFAVALADQRRGENAAAADRFQKLAASEKAPPEVREESLYRLGEARFATGAYDEAARRYEQLLTEFPDGPWAREARKRLVWARYLQGDFRAAVAAAVEWRRRYPQAEDTELDYLHAASLVGMEQYEEALPLLRRLIEGGKAPAETTRLARYHEIVALANLQRHQETVPRVDAFTADYPKAAEGPMLSYIAGAACLELKDFEKAASYLRRAEELLVGDPARCEDARRLLADALLKLDKPAEAAAVFRRLAQNRDLPQAPFYQFKAGECERKAGNIEAAIRDFEVLVAEFPQAVAESRAALQHLGELYASAGDAERAVAIVRGLLDKAAEPEDKARFRFFLGYLHNLMGRHEEAVAELREALAEGRAGPVAPAACFYLCTSLMELGRREEALDAFAPVLRLPPEERPPVPAELLLRLEPLYYARNQLDLSEAICRWLMAGSDLAIVQESVLRLAALMAAQNRFEAAETELETLRGRRQKAAAEGVANLPPEEAIASLQAELFLLRGQIPQAVVAAEQCLASPELDEESATRARWVLAEALARQGHPAQALPYAVKAYILGDHPTYSSRALVLAVQLLVGLHRMDEAATAWAELRTRYPVVAESVSGTPEVKAILARQAGQAPAPQ